jgi:hypothetical protein
VHHTKTVNINGARVTVGAGDGWSIVIARMLWLKVIQMHNANHKEQVYKVGDLGSAAYQKYLSFVDLVQYTEEIDGDLGMEWPTADSDIEELWKAFNALPGAVDQIDMIDWLDAIREVQRGPGDEELKPDVDPKK